MAKVDTSQLYIGIDLNDQRAVVSFYRNDMPEPTEATSAADDSRTEFPLALLRMENGKYYYGEEALRFRSESENGFRDDLYRKALSGAETEREDLFRFIRRLLYFRKHYEKDRAKPYDLTITVPEVSPEVIDLMEALRIELHITHAHFRITDYRESFFDYISMQDRSIWKQDTCLFSLSEDTLTVMRAYRITYGNERAIEVVQDSIPVSPDVYADDSALDSFLAEEVTKAISGNVVSGVYLIGKRFDGEWRHAIMDAIGANKRIFVGENLFSRGAALGACRTRTEKHAQIHYHCEYRIHHRLFLRVLDRQHTTFIPLLIEHANWFESHVSFRLLYNGKQYLELWDSEDVRNAEPYAILELTDFPKRPAKSLFLDLNAYLKSDHLLCIEVRDAGFGAMYESDGRSWLFELALEDSGKAGA